MRRLVRALKLAARDPRIPGPVRAVAAFGLLPIPGPVGELVRSRNRLGGDAVSIPGTYLEAIGTRR